MKSIKRKQVSGVLVGGGLVGILFLLGCRSPLEKLQERMQLLSDERLVEVLERNMAVTGSLGLWSRVGGIEGEAITTIRESAGGSWYVDQSHQLTPRKRGWLRVSSNLPEGVRHSQLDRKGRLKRELVLTGSGESQELTGGDWAEEAAKLRLVGQALTQGYGLLKEGWTLRYVGLERKGGRLTHKIEISGEMIAAVEEKEPTPKLRLGVAPVAKEKESSPKPRFELPGVGAFMASFKGENKGYEGDDQLVVWIDSETYLIDRLLVRYRSDSESGGGLSYLGANLGGYQEVLEGMALPRYIGVVRSDRFHQFSEEETLRIEYQDLRVLEGKN